MERVQITGGGNGVYTDTKGRRLYTMGDYSPAVGAWVWTNGVTIYGHQSGKTQPVTPIDSAVLPVILREYNPNTGYGNKFFSQLFSNVEIRKLGNASIDAINYINDSSHAYIQTNSEDWYNIITGEYLGRFSVSQISIDDNGDLISLWYQGGYYCNDGRQESYNLTPLYNRTIFRETDSDGRSLANWKESSSESKRNDPYIEFRRNGKIIQRIDLSHIFAAAINKVQVATEKLHESGDDRGVDAIKSSHYARPKYYIWGTANVQGNPGFLKPDGSYRAYVQIGISGIAYPWVTVKGAEGQAVRYWINCADYYYSSTYTVENETIQLTSEYETSSMRGCGYPAPPIKKIDYEKDKKAKKDFSFKPFKNYDFAAVRWVDDAYPFEADDGTVYYNSYYVFGSGWNYSPPRPDFVSGRLWHILDDELREAWISAGLSCVKDYVKWSNIVFYPDFNFGNGFYGERNGSHDIYFKDRAGNTIFVLRFSSPVYVRYFNAGGALVRICKSGAGYWVSTGSYLLYILNGEIVFHIGGYNDDTHTMDNYLVNTTFWSLTPFKQKRKLTKAISKLARIIKENSK